MPQIPEIIKASTDPAAGGEIVYTADEDMIIHSVYFVLTTSAVVANRQVGLWADDGNAANLFFRSGSTYTHTAGTGVAYCFSEGAPITVLSGMVLGFLPALGLRLRKGDRIRTVTVAFDPGDNYSAMTIQAERETQ
jgi:hypothetical protein